MGKLLGRLAIFILIMAVLAGCGKKERDEWLEAAALDADESVSDLYKKALKEDILIVYTVTTRAAQTKESFEAQYPGLCVEIRDLRSPDLIDAVEANFKNGGSDCDVVICTDNSGDFRERLVKTSAVVPYLPKDIAVHMSARGEAEPVNFVNEAELLFYSAKRWDSCPITNIWELTEEKYHGLIYMPNPLRSFSTYALCSATFAHADDLKKALEAYGHSEIVIPAGSNAAEVFWKMAAKNIIFTNSSDEVVEALGNGVAGFGFAVSSKMRLNSLGYGLMPVYSLEPFSGCRTSYALMLARNSRNINTAKLFIRWMMGEADGTGEGYSPFNTEGTWPARDDITGVNEVALDEATIISAPAGEDAATRQKMEEFWAQVLKSSATEQK